MKYCGPEMLNYLRCKLSTEFVPDKNIPFPRIKTFNHNGVTVDTIDEEGDVILTDGKNYFYARLGSEMETISFEENEPKIISSHMYKGVIFTRYGGNDPEKIIEAIESFFDVRLISEYEDEFDEIVGE